MPKEGSSGVIGEGNSMYSTIYVYLTNFSAQGRKIKINPLRKISYIFSKKKNKKKKQKKKKFLHFKRKLRAQKVKKATLKNFLYIGKWNFLVLSLKNVHIFSKK